MKKPAADLPVDPERLRREFPSLSDDDLEAYVVVTRRVLATPSGPRRSAFMRELLQKARDAFAKSHAGTTLRGEDRQLQRYWSALSKIQRSTAR